MGRTQTRLRSRGWGPETKRLSKGRLRQCCLQPAAGMPAVVPRGGSRCHTGKGKEASENQSNVRKEKQQKDAVESAEYHGPQLPAGQLNRGTGGTSGHQWRPEDEFR